MTKKQVHQKWSLLSKIMTALTLNEIITICISLAALLISLATLYFSVFYKRVALIGCLLAWDELHSPDDEQDSMFGEAEFSISNTGNRELLVRGVEIDWERPPKFSYLPILTSKELPCVAKPAQILLVKVSIARAFMKQIEFQNQLMVIKFDVIAPDGKRYFLAKHFTPFTDDAELSNTDWEPFTLQTTKIKFPFFFNKK